MTKSRQNMKNRLLQLLDKMLLRKRAVLESVNDPLKNIGQIEHSRHRRGYNFLVNLLARGGLYRSAAVARLGPRGQRLTRSTSRYLLNPLNSPHFKLDRPLGPLAPRSPPTIAVKIFPAVG